MIDGTAALVRQPGTLLDLAFALRAPNSDTHVIDAQLVRAGPHKVTQLAMLVPLLDAALSTSLHLDHVKRRQGLHLLSWKSPQRMEKQSADGGDCEDDPNEYGVE